MCVCVCVCVCVTDREDYIVLVMNEWSIGGMLVSEEDQRTWTKTNSATFSHHISHMGLA